MSNMDLYEEWKRKTEAEGAVVALASAIVEVFAARGLEVSPAQHARIVACTDSSVLLRWIKRAATATSVEEVLAPLS